MRNFGFSLVLSVALLSVAYSAPTGTVSPVSNDKSPSTAPEGAKLKDDKASAALKLSGSAEDNETASAIRTYLTQIDDILSSMKSSLSHDNILAKPLVNVNEDVVQQPVYGISQQIIFKPVYTEVLEKIRRPVIIEVEEIVRRPVVTYLQQVIKRPLYAEHIVNPASYNPVSQSIYQAPLKLQGQSIHVVDKPSTQSIQLPTQVIQPFAAGIVYGSYPSYGGSYSSGYGLGLGFGLGSSYGIGSYGLGSSSYGYLPSYGSSFSSSYGGSSSSSYGESAQIFLTPSSCRATGTCGRDVESDAAIPISAANWNLMAGSSPMSYNNYSGEPVHVSQPTYQNFGEQPPNAAKTAMPSKFSPADLDELTKNQKFVAEVDALVQKYAHKPNFGEQPPNAAKTAMPSEFSPADLDELTKNQKFVAEVDALVQKYAPKPNFGEQPPNAAKTAMPSEFSLADLDELTKNEKFVAEFDALVQKYAPKPAAKAAEEEKESFNVDGSLKMIEKLAKEDPNM